MNVAKVHKMPKKVTISVSGSGSDFHIDNEVVVTDESLDGDEVHIQWAEGPSSSDPWMGIQIINDNPSSDGDLSSSSQSLVKASQMVVQDLLANSSGQCIDGTISHSSAQDTRVHIQSYQSVMGSVLGGGSNEPLNKCKQEISSALERSQISCRNPSSDPDDDFDSFLESVSVLGDKSLRKTVMRRRFLLMGRLTALWIRENKLILSGKGLDDPERRRLSHQKEVLSMRLAIDGVIDRTRESNHQVGVSIRQVDEGNALSTILSDTDPGAGPSTSQAEYDASLDRIINSNRRWRRRKVSSSAMSKYVLTDSSSDSD